MYYPYGGAQQPPPQSQQQEEYYQQQKQLAPSSTSWKDYTNSPYSATTTTTTTNTNNHNIASNHNNTNITGPVGNGPQLQHSQYYDPYMASQTNGTQGYNNYYNYTQQSQQPQQTSMTSGNAHSMRQQTNDQSPQCLPQTTINSGNPPHSHHIIQKEQNTSRVEKYARPPPKRSVDLKGAPNPRRDIPQKPSNDVVRTSTGQLPLSASGFISIDDGNASPKFFRPTTNSIPSDEYLLKESKVFFGAVLTPLCPPLDLREVVPVIEGRPPIRCNRCRGYMSCHARFTDMGRNWICPFCSMSNIVENEYFCNLDQYNNRLDRAEKPELCRGSVEYDVGAYTEYALCDEKDTPIPTRPMHYLFLLDISQKAASTFLSDYVDGLMKSLHEMAERYPQCRVAFITYASTLHFYNVRHPRIPQLIVADVDNPFVPLPFTSFCWLTLGTDLDIVDAFLMSVPEYADDLQETDSAMGAAVQVAMLILAGQHGGHVILCGHKAPQRGIGTIKLREQHVLYGTEREKELLRPLEGFWKNIAISCAKQQISFDLHMFADEYCELVTLMQPCHLSNGHVHLFANYDRKTDATKVQAALDQILLQEAGYAGVLRVRCSAGLRVQNYHGHFLSQNSHDMDLAHIHETSTFFVEFTHEGKLEKTSFVYFQIALLYTTRRGERRVRVHSIRMPVITTLSGVFEADLEAILIGYIHEAIGNTVNKGLKYARQLVQERVLKMLIAYRRVCTSNVTTSLLMPSRLRLIPLYVLCLLKADAFVEGTTVRIDDRVQKLFQLMTIPIDKCLTYLYPTLYALHNLLTEYTYGVLNEETGRCVLPGCQQLIFDSITTDGVYLLCDEQAQHVYLWIGASVSSQVSMELFGTENIMEVGHTVLFDSFNERLRNILFACLMRGDGMQRLIILHEKDRGEEAFFRQLKEENEGGSKGYDEFLVHLHSEVNKSMR